MTMFDDAILPFERGRTACDGNTPVSGNYAQWVGHEYTVRDTVHGTGQPVILRVVSLENDIVLARKFYKFDNDSKDFGRQISGVNDVHGGYAVALDDAIPEGTVLKANDLVYAIVGGPAELRTEMTAVNLSAHAPVVSDNAGYVDGAAPGANHCILGRIDAACTTTNTKVVVHINHGFLGGEGATGT